MHAMHAYVCYATYAPLPVKNLRILKMKMCLVSIAEHLVTFVGRPSV